MKPDPAGGDTFRARRGRNDVRSLAFDGWTTGAVEATVIHAVKPHSSAARWPDEADDRLASAILGSAEVALFENAYAAYSGEAQHTALAFLGEAQLARDAVHNAYLEILRYLLNGGRWSDAADARAVVLRNTRWAALKMLRTQRRRREHGVADVPAEVEDDTAWARWEARAVCEQVVAQLRPHQQHALHLQFTEGLSHSEAAARLGLTTSGYESLLQRALAAARRAARGSGLLPGFAGLWGHAVNKGRTAAQWHARTRWPGLTGTAKLAAVALLAVCVVHGVDALPRDDSHVPAPHLSLAGAPPAAAVADPIPAADETVEDLSVIDAVALHSDTHPGVVLALGQGGRCRCWVVARSADAGGHWVMSAGPASLSRGARLAAAAGFPRDPRIVVTDRTGTGVMEWMSAGFEVAFERTSSTIPINPAAHPSSCSGSGSGVTCLGQPVTLTGTASDTDGNSLRTLDHLLYFPSTGGILCSADGGRSWAPTCVSAHR